MPHDSTKVLLGSGTTSERPVVQCFASSPATFPAGTAVRCTSGGLLSVAKAAGMFRGISLGKSLSDDLKTDVCSKGLGIPILVELKPARGTVTITSYANLVSGTDDAIIVGATTFTAQTGSVTPGGTTFQAATGNTETAVSLAAQINAHATAGALVVATSSGAVVTITAKGNTTAGNDIILAYTDNDTNVGATITNVTDGKLAGGGGTTDFVVIGAKVYVSDVTGKDDDPNSEATISDATYVSGLKTGVTEAGVEVAVALVDMQGGL